MEERKSSAYVHEDGTSEGQALHFLEHMSDEILSWSSLSGFHTIWFSKMP